MDIKIKVRKRRDACNKTEYIVGFEVLMALTMKGMVWVVMACSLDIARCFRATYHLHLQCQKVNQARNWQKQTADLAACLCSAEMIGLSPNYMALQPTSLSSEYILFQTI
jgi:hypothetical protein